MKLVVLILVLTAQAPLYAGKLYRWIDANGQVHFSDQRPIASIDEVGSNPVYSGSSVSESFSGIRPGETEWLERYAEREAERLSSRKRASRAYAAKSQRCVMARNRYKKALHDSVSGNESERKRVKEYYASMRADCQ